MLNEYLRRYGSAAGKLLMPTWRAARARASAGP
jgi:hypothetical protein